MHPGRTLLRRPGRRGTKNSVALAESVVHRRLPRGPAATGVADVPLLLVLLAAVGRTRLVAWLGHVATSACPLRRIARTTAGTTSAPAVPAAAQASTIAHETGSSGWQPKNPDNPGVWTITARTASEPAAVASTSGLRRPAHA